MMKEVSPNEQLRSFVTKTPAKKRRIGLLISALNAGADPRLAIRKGEPALITAIRNGHDADAIELLISRGADPDTKAISTRHTYRLGEGETALAIAACSVYRGNAEQTVRLLIHSGANINLADSRGSTALDHILAEMVHCRATYEWTNSTARGAILGRINWFYALVGPLLRISEMLLTRGAVPRTMSVEDANLLFTSIVEFWNDCVRWQMENSSSDQA